VLWSGAPAKSAMPRCRARPEFLAFPGQVIQKNLPDEQSVFHPCGVVAFIVKVFCYAPEFSPDLRVKCGMSVRVRVAIADEHSLLRLEMPQGIPVYEIH
jgi:hypothetical protein